MDDNQKENNLATHLIAFIVICGLSFYLGFYFEYTKLRDSDDFIIDYSHTIQEKIKSPKEIIADVKLYSGDKKDLKKTMFYIFAGLLIGYAYIYSEMLRKGNYWKKEKGSAKWGSKADRSKYKLHMEQDNKSKNNNIILSDTEFLPINTRVIHRNRNVMVYGGSGAGKTRWLVKPNILQGNTNFVITDPKGELHRTTSYVLEKMGYEVTVLNLVEPHFSNTYNPFRYIENETDITILADCIIKNTENPNSKGDQFWVRAETALLKALMYFVYYECSPEEQHMKTVLEMITTSQEKQEEDSILTMKFKELQSKDPGHIACQFYNGIFLQAPYETKMSILISLSVRLQLFGVPEIYNLCKTDTINIDDCNKKKATYVIIPDSHSAYNVIAAMFFTQSFQRLYFLADSKYMGALPVPYQFILDEFANLGAIPSFPSLISTMRGREISVFSIVQAKSQLEKLYDKDAETIIGNCDVQIYLGGNDIKTAEDISKKLGKTTIHIYQNSYSKGRNGSTSQSENIAARELMTPDELLRLDDNKCIVMVRGFFPFLSNKYNLKRHPMSIMMERDDYLITTEQRFRKKL